MRERERKEKGRICASDGGAMYPHLLRKAERRFARVGLSQKPKEIHEYVPPPFVLPRGVTGCVLLSCPYPSYA